MNKNYLISGLIALFVSAFSFTAIHYFSKHKTKSILVEHVNSTPSQTAVFTINEDGKTIPLDFQETAKDVLDAVVHIKSTHIYSGNTQPYQWRSIPDPFKDFFGDGLGQKFFFESPSPNQSKQPKTKLGSGSGVIFSDDGYIITNNHVIAESDDIEVTLHDNRTFKARVVGTDPSTDLALLQIKAKDLPYVPFVDSDNVNIGQWVMAVGNPLGLNSTVTAGIVSAKGRNINILKEKYAVENFIQTDAAINPGNSGGALVNLEGGLIGINTAIASPTGTFAGYGFAIPSNIVSKVMEDLIEFGSVQRGVLGIMIKTIDGNFAKKNKLHVSEGVYVDSLLSHSAAGKAGIKKGDIIVKVNDNSIKTSPELQGEIAQFRPGDEIEISYIRNGKRKNTKVILNNRDGNTKLAPDSASELERILGIEMIDLDKKMLNALNIDTGIKIEKVYPGKVKKHTQMQDGFIITHIDGEKVKDKENFFKTLKKKKGGVMLQGIYEDIPGEYYYAFGME